MSMRTPIKSRTVRLSITVQEAINLECLLAVAMDSLDGGKERYQDLFKKLRDSAGETIDKAIAEEENGNV